MQPTVTKTSEAPAERPQRTLRDYAGLTLRGMAMGASDIVPGVSGGTMAFILGIYEELIDSIRTIGRPYFIQTVLKLRIKEAFEILNWQFLMAVGIGILLAVLTMAQGLEWLLLNQPVYLWSFFFGLVLASVITVSRRVGRWAIPLVVALGFTAVVAFLIVGAVPAQTPNALWFIFLSGAIVICAMILPGLSGAFLLVLLGKYQYVLSAVNNRDFLILIVFSLGAGVGIVTFAQILSWLFKRYHDVTVAVLTGLMLGSLRKVWPWKQDIAWLTDNAGEFILDSHGELIVTVQANILPDFSSAAGLTEFGIALLLACAGFSLIIVLDRLANRGDRRAAAAPLS